MLSFCLQSVFKAKLIMDYQQSAQYCHQRLSILHCQHGQQGQIDWGKCPALFGFQ